MGSMQCNVDFGYRLSFCCRAEENHGIPSSSCPVAEPGVTHLLVSSGGFQKHGPYWQSRRVQLSYGSYSIAHCMCIG